MAVSYGVIWTGPNNYYSINWDVEKDNRFSPHLGPSSTNRVWNVFTHGGEWIDMFENRMCAGNGQAQSRPIIYNQLDSGISCSYYYGNTWQFRSYSIDIDGDGYGHTADVFPFEATQQFDTDLDGYGDNIFGNNSDECPNEPWQFNTR